MSASNAADTVAEDGIPPPLIPLKGEAEYVFFFNEEWKVKSEEWKVKNRLTGFETTGVADVKSEKWKIA